MVIEIRSTNQTGGVMPRKLFNINDVFSLIERKCLKCKQDDFTETMKSKSCGIILTGLFTSKPVEWSHSKNGLLQCSGFKK